MCVYLMCACIIQAYIYSLQAYITLLFKNPLPRPPSSLPIFIAPVPLKKTIPKKIRYYYARVKKVGKK